MIEIWMMLALAGHVLNAAAFLIDKQLLTHAWKTSATYATLISLPSLLLVLGLPWIERMSPVSTIIAFVSGVAFTAALWNFFEAMKRGSIGFVVPVVGVVIPIISLAGEHVALRTTFHPQQLFGFIVLLISLWLITRESTLQKARQPIGFALLAATLFAVSSVLVKDVYSMYGFAAPFVVSRIGAGMAGLVLLAGVTSARRELRAFSKLPKSNIAPLGLTLLGQSSGIVGFVLIQLAFVSGSVAVVNALQAVQYVCINAFTLYRERRMQTLASDALVSLLIRTALGVVGIGIGLYSLSL